MRSIHKVGDKMKKECLDICDKPLIESECWSYYKFAMMQTLDEIPLWLTNHFFGFCDQ